MPFREGWNFANPLSDSTIGIKYIIGGKKSKKNILGERAKESNVVIRGPLPAVGETSFVQLSFVIFHMQHVWLLILHVELPLLILPGLDDEVL